MEDKKQILLANINFENFFNECYDDKILTTRKKHFWRSSYAGIQHMTFNYNKFNEDFCDSLSIYGDENGMNAIKFSKEEFIAKLEKQLNFPHTNKACDMRISISNQIKELKTCTNEYKLESKFPVLYKEYQDGKDYKKKFDAILDFSEDKSERYEAENMKRYYYRTGMRYIPQYYVKEQAQLYTNFLINGKRLTDYLNNTNLLRSISKGINKDKFDLYIANAFLDEALKCSDEDKRKIYINYLDEYIKVRKNVTIHSEYGDEVNFDTIYNAYYNLKKRLEDDSYILDWEFIPEGKNVKPRSFITGLTGTLNINKDFTKEQILGQKKYKLYEGSKYRIRAKGICINKGYTAYFYDNGSIILERMPEEDNIIAGANNATYILNTSNFERLSPKDKNELRKKKLCPVIVHKGNWEERVNKIINTPSTEETKANTESLIKKLSKKSTNK